MEIRKLTIDQYEELVNLWRRAGLPFKPKGRDSKEAIARQMNANPEFFLGAFENGRLVGAVIVSSDGRKGWINRLAVDPDFRRRGVASTLVAEAERVLRKHGVRIFCALIEAENEASRRLFKKCGYLEHRDIIYFSKRESDDV
jgi:ribosomal protein S18 acetylase RimI-like enzyme